MLPRPRRLQDLHQLVTDAFTRDIPDERRIPPHQIVRGVLDPKAQLSDHADAAQHPQWIVLERAFGHRAQKATCQVGLAVERVEQGRLGRGRVDVQGDGVHGEIPQRQIVQQIGDPEPRHVHLQRLARRVGHDRPAHIALVIQDKRRAAEGCGHRPGKPDAALRHDQVEVMADPPQQPVAHEAADQPGRAFLAADEGDDFVGQR